MKLNNLQLFTLVLFSISISSYASTGKEMLLKWSDTTDQVSRNLKSQGEFEDAVEFINVTFKFKRTLVLQFGTDDGPLYDPQLDAIQIPHEFYAHVITLFEQIEPDDKSLQREYAIDTVLHALFHELGHAVIDQYEIPVLGKEEDAADALASVLLIEYYDNGAEMAINAAELFALESDERGSLQEEDFWDEPQS